MTSYSSPHTLDMAELNTLQEKKLYIVKVLAKDKLGNASEKLIEFYVGKDTLSDASENEIEFYRVKN